MATLGIRVPRRTHEIVGIHLNDNGAIDAYALAENDKRCYTHDEILDMMVRGHVFFYTHDGHQRTPVEAVIKTKADHSRQDNLLSLPQFSIVEDE